MTDGGSKDNGLLGPEQFERALIDELGLNLSSQVRRSRKAGRKEEREKEERKGSPFLFLPSFLFSCLLHCSFPLPFPPFLLPSFPPQEAQRLFVQQCDKVKLRQEEEGGGRREGEREREKKREGGGSSHTR
jgi:hypothetical protein